VIGMTNLQEAKLAREAEIAYATVAMATDYDCWHETEADVNVADVIAVLAANVDKVRTVIVETARLLATAAPISCAGVMEDAILSGPGAITADARRRLALLIGKYI
jgi:5'-methylthioadenosine phosphorylase